MAAIGKFRKSERVPLLLEFVVKRLVYGRQSKLAMSTVEGVI